LDGQQTYVEIISLAKRLFPRQIFDGHPRTIVEEAVARMKRIRVKGRLRILFEELLKRGTRLLYLWIDAIDIAPTASATNRGGIGAHFCQRIEVAVGRRDVNPLITMLEGKNLVS